jgi:hypothetical protein
MNHSAWVTALRRRAFRGDREACFALGSHLLHVGTFEEKLTGYGFVRQAAEQGHDGAAVRLRLEEEMGGDLRVLWERRRFVSPSLDEDQAALKEPAPFTG